MAAITAELKLEIGKFKKGITAAKTQAGSLAKSAGTAGKRISANLFKGVAAAARAFAKAAKVALAAVTAAGIAAAGAITMGLKKAFDLGGRLSDVAARIGDSAGNAQILETMFGQAGVSAEKMAPSIQKMQRAIIEARDRGGTLSEPFDELGLSLKDLAGMGSVEAFNTISKAIGNLDSAAERSARAMQIFGKSGGELLTLFSDPEALGKAQSMVGGQADILSKHANEFDRASDIWGGLSSKITGLWVGMGADMISHFLPALEALNKIDLAPIGKRLGESLSNAIYLFRAAWDVLSAGDLGAMLKDSLVIGFKESINVLWKGLQAAIAAAITYMIEGFHTTVKIFQVLGRADFWAGIGTALNAAAAGFGSLMLRTVATVMETLSKIKGMGKLAGFGESLRGKASALSDAARGAGAASKDLLTPAVNEVKDRIADAGKAVGKSFKETFQETSDVLSTDKERARIAALAKEVRDRANAMKADRDKASSAAPSAATKSAATTASGAARLVRTPAVIASSLAKIGGGGRVANVKGQLQRAQLAEEKQQNKTLKKIELKIGKLQGSSPVTFA